MNHHDTTALRVRQKWFTTKDTKGTKGTKVEPPRREGAEKLDIDSADNTGSGDYRHSPRLGVSGVNQLLDLINGLG